MSDATEPEEEPTPKKGKKGLLISLVLAILLGGGAFYAVFSGLVLGPKTEEVAAEEVPVLEETEKATFVAMEPIMISLGRSASHQLRFNAQLEVEPTKAEDVANVMPRILDVLNGYLRAVDVSDLEDPAALIRLRVEMLRRIELVTGDGHVKDLLITEFVFT
jgi:flagellar FliL protein